MRKYLFAIVSFQFVLQIQAQNIVNNSGFESYSTLPDSYNELNRASGWSNCNGHYVSQGSWGSPDYLSLLGSGVALLPCGYISCATPHSGNGIAGFITYNGNLTNNREYIRTYLVNPMVVGQQYEVSFFITRGTNALSKFVSNNVGILFSVDSTWQTSPYTMLPHTPQLNVSSVIDSTDWKEYNFTFTADSAYNYITIGNYYSDANTTLVSKIQNSNQIYAYYMVDDISVTPSVNEIIETNEFDQQVKIFPNPFTNQIQVKAPSDQLITFELQNILGETIPFTMATNVQENFTVYNIIPSCTLSEGLYSLKVWRAGECKIIQLLEKH